MWPRGDPSLAGPGGDITARRGKGAGMSGFVSFMTRGAAEECVREMDGFNWNGSVLRVGWSKAVPIAAKAAYGGCQRHWSTISYSDNMPGQWWTAKILTFVAHGPVLDQSRETGRTGQQKGGDILNRDLALQDEADQHPGLITPGHDREISATITAHGVAPPDVVQILVPVRPDLGLAPDLAQDLATVVGKIAAHDLPRNLDTEPNDTDGMGSVQGPDPALVLATGAARAQSHLSGIKGLGLAITHVRGAAIVQGATTGAGSR